MGTESTASANTAAIEQGTGLAWDRWIAPLDEWGARERSHRQIVGHVRQVMSGLHGEGHHSGWWAQSVTVAYEQHIGRRQPGQRSDGSFECSISRTVTGTGEDAARTLATLLDQLTASDGRLNGVPVTSGPAVSATEKWYYVRLTLSDGGRVSASIDAKKPSSPAADDPPRTRIGLGHLKLDSAESAAAWKAFWKQTLSALPADVRPTAGTQAADPDDGVGRSPR